MYRVAKYEYHTQTRWDDNVMSKTLTAKCVARYKNQFASGWFFCRHTQKLYTFDISVHPNSGCYPCGYWVRWDQELLVDFCISYLLMTNCTFLISEPKIQLTFTKFTSIISLSRFPTNKYIPLLTMIVTTCKIDWQNRGVCTKLIFQ